MKILITGGSGFIGKNLVELWNDKYDIVHLRSSELNLLDSLSVERYFKKNYFDVVLHCAKEDTVNKNNVSEYEVLDHNLRMFFNLAKCEKLYGKMLYLGSGAQYNRKDMPDLVNEDFYAGGLPEDAYGFSKYIMSEYANKSKNIYNLCLFGVFGKYEAYQRRFISNNICRNLKGLPMTIRQDALFDYIYIKDLAKIIEWFLINEPKYHHYNVCSGQPVRLKELADIIKKVAINKTVVKIAQGGLQKSYTGDNHRLKKEIANLKLTPLEESIEELYYYYQDIIEDIDCSEL